MENINVKVFQNHEDERESWRVVADNDGEEIGAIQIRRMTENRAIAFLFAFETDAADAPVSSFSDWQFEVANGDTRLGFDAWTQHNAERDGAPVISKAAILTALVQRVIENAPKYGIALLQLTAKTEDTASIEALLALGFTEYQHFENPNTGNDLTLLGRVL